MNIPKRARRLVAEGLLKIVELVIENDEQAYKKNPSTRNKNHLDEHQERFATLKKQVDEL